MRIFSSIAVLSLLWHWTKILTFIRKLMIHEKAVEESGAIYKSWSSCENYFRAWRWSRRHGSHCLSSCWKQTEAARSQCQTHNVVWVLHFFLLHKATISPHVFPPSVSLSKRERILAAFLFCWSQMSKQIHLFRQSTQYDFPSSERSSLQEGITFTGYSRIHSKWRQPHSCLSLLKRLICHSWNSHFCKYGTFSSWTWMFFLIV